MGRCRCVKKGQDCTQSQTCCGKLSCINNVCARAQSGPCTLIPDFSATSCASDAECCSGICSIVPGNDGKSVGRCISATTVWVKLTWTGYGDLDSWTWMPAGTIDQSGTGSSFPNGGDVVMWQRLFYPWLPSAEDTSDSFSSPKVTPDVWLDVDDT